MGVVTYIGKAQADLTLLNGAELRVVPGVNYTFSDNDCSALLAQQPIAWLPGDVHTATLVPVVYATGQQFGSFASDYDSTKTYQRGQVVTGPYLCLLDGTTNLDPANPLNALNWKSELSPSVLLSNTTPAVAPGVRWAVNVKDGKYGAKGDGVTDDTAAIVAAQADARALKKPLYFPASTSAYKITSKILLQAGEHWIGDHWGPGQNSIGSQLNFVFSSIGSCFEPFAPLLGFTDGVTFEDLFIVGDSTNTTIGFFLQSCRYWKFERVWINGMTQQELYTYGRRTSQGTLDSTNWGDCTHNKFISCVFVAPVGGLDAVRMGGTLVNATTISTDSGTTVTVADGTLIFGSSGTIVCADNGEWINFTGKTGNNLTGCTRGIANTTSITHPPGTAVAVRAAMGTSNMHTFIDCIFSGNTGARYGLWVEAGSSSFFARSSVVGCGSDGLRVSWYGNDFNALVAENNVGHGAWFDGSLLTHDNWIKGMHDGGTNFGGLPGGLILDDSGANSWEAFGRGLKLSNNLFNGSTLIGPQTYYTLVDGLPRWKDAAGYAHVLSYTPRPQLVASARGVLAETFPQVLGITDFAPVSSGTPNGTIYSGLVGLQAGDVVTNIISNVGVAGNGTAPSLIKLALLSKAGVVLATTADLHADARWTSTGIKVCALSAPYTITADDVYYLAFLQSGVWGTTAMQMWQINNAAGSVNLIGAGFRAFAITAAQTDIAGTLALAAGGANSAFWLACS